MAGGDSLRVAGTLQQYYACLDDRLLYNFEFGPGEDITVPTNSQSFTRMDAGVNSEGDLIVIEVQGFIAVD